MTSAGPAVNLRIAVQLPAPFALADYEPFRPIGKGLYGVAVLSDYTQASLAEMTVVLRKVARRGATVGVCPVPRVKAVFFDMDATVINEESLVELATYADACAEVAAVTERAMAGELDFREALTARVALLKGLPATVLPTVAERLTLTSGIQPFVAFCRELGVPTFLVSGGFVQLADPTARKVGFAGYRANTLGVENGKLTGTVVGDIVDAAAKKQYLLATCAKLGIAPAEVAAVGDGANDIPMLQAAGVAVGHRPKPVVLDHVHAVNTTGNHAFLAPLLFGRDVSILRSRLRT